MKKLFFIISVVVCTQICTWAQVTVSPRVEAQYTSIFSELNILRVDITEDATYVMIEDITSPKADGLRLSFSSGTTLRHGAYSTKIKAWGVWDRNEFYEKEFDRQYSLTPDRRYILILAFPPIPPDTDEISIRENVEGGFYWHSIHLNGNVAPEKPGSTPERYDDIPFSPTGSGTCFALNEEGYIATCYHVVEGSRRFKIRGIGNNFKKPYDATLVSVDKYNDLAILKIDDPSFTGFTNIPYRISDRLADVGEEIFVLGYPLRPIMGDEIKLTNGLISSLSGFQGKRSTYQVSATVQKGNSGGPLFDHSGNIIGIVNARLFVESASYAVKSRFLTKAATDNSINLNQTNTIKDLSLAEQVKKIRRFVFIIEVQ